MVIFVEGPDGSGKTTLVNQLNERFGIPMYVGPTPLEDNYASRYIEGVREHGNKIYVSDRSPITEFVYRIVDDCGTSMTLKSFVDFVTLPDVKFIRCINENAFENAIARGEDNITIKSIHDSITDCYRFAFDMLRKFAIGNSKILEYDWKYDDLNRVLRFILN